MSDAVQHIDAKDARAVLDEEKEQRALSGFGLLCEDRVNKLWGALVLLSKFERAIHGESLVAFLEARQHEADRVRYDPAHPATFYALRGVGKYRGWTQAAVIQTLNLAIKDRHMVKVMRQDGKNYFVPARPSEMGTWNVTYTDLPFDPRWTVRINALDLTKEDA